MFGGNFLLSLLFKRKGLTLSTLPFSSLPSPNKTSPPLLSLSWRRKTTSPTFTLLSTHPPNNNNNNLCVSNCYFPQKRVTLNMRDNTCSTKMYSTLNGARRKNLCKTWKRIYSLSFRIKQSSNFCFLSTSIYIFITPILFIFDSKSCKEDIYPHSDVCGANFLLSTSHEAHHRKKKNLETPLLLDFLSFLYS